MQRSPLVGIQVRTSNKTIIATDSATRMLLELCRPVALVVTSAKDGAASSRPAAGKPVSSRPSTWGMRFPDRGSHYDLTGISQQWLRNSRATSASQSSGSACGRPWLYAATR